MPLSEGSTESALVVRWIAGVIAYYIITKRVVLQQNDAGLVG